MKLYNTFFLILSILVIVSCNNTKKKNSEPTSKDTEKTIASWTQEEKAVFSANCEALLKSEGVENPKDYCDCLLEVTMTNHPDPFTATELTQNEIVAMFEASECLDDILLIKLEDPWTEEVEAIFLEHCKKAQIESGKSQEEADSYCDCALDQIKIIIPNPQHVMSLTEEELQQILSECK